MANYRSNVIDRPLGYFLKQFDHFECKYESVVSSGCPVLLGGYLKGRLDTLPNGKYLATNQEPMGEFIIICWCDAIIVALHFIQL